MGTKVLLTGFEPFLDNETYPSRELVISSSFSSYRRLVLPVSYTKARKELLEAMGSFNPDLVLSFGLAATRKEITIEEKGVNLMDSRSPDSDGVIFHKEPIDKSLPSEIATSFDLTNLLTDLRGKGFAISLSSSAGKYICNEVFFTALSKKPRSLFIHLPLLLASSLENDIALAKSILDFINKSH